MPTWSEASSERREPESIPAELAGLRRVAERPGRHRMVRLIEPLVATGWWRRLDAIKITGSNGKGSVATMTASILAAAGVRVGLTVSPHVSEFGERMQVDGRPAPVAAIDPVLAWLHPRLRDPLADPDDPPTTFEAITALAARVFERAGVETVVAEAGIGGRNDATGVFPGRDSAIVSVDLEHTAILGSTLAGVAADKADLAGDGTSLRLGPLDPDLVALVRDHVAPRRVEVVPFDRLPPLPADVCLAAIGEHQRANARLAAALARRWLAAHRPTLDAASIDDAIRRGLSDARPPLCFERIGEDPPIWLDGAHTRDAVACLAETVRQAVDRPIVLVAGLSVDKDPSVLDPLVAIASRVVLTRAAERGASPEPLRRRTEALGRSVKVVEPAPRAVGVAIEEAARDGSAVVVAGGVLLAREIRSAWIAAR